MAPKVKYSKEDLKKALEAMQHGMSLRKAAEKFGVARSTLQRKARPGQDLEKKAGAPTVFSKEEEKILVDWVKYTQRCAFPITRETLMYSVAKLASKMGRTFPGGKTMPGRKWYEGFLRRHPDITSRTSQNLTSARSSITQKALEKWYAEVQGFFTENNLLSVFEDSQRVFNGDETAFYLNPKPGKVLAEKGCKVVYTAAGADEKFNVTTLITGNAAGQLAPPIIVYRYARIPQNIADTMPASWAIAKSENGWMTQEAFYEYITNIFVPWLEENKIETPVIFFLDGYTSHLSLPLTEYCMKKNIFIVALLPNATHLLQPMDVSVFHSLKASWKEKVANWRMEKGGCQLQKQDFAPLLKTVLDEMGPQPLISGFRTCGLVPWDPTKVKIPLQHPMPQVAAKNKINSDSMRSFLNILGKKIGSEKLTRFQDCRLMLWTGEVQDTSLFTIWKETKEQLESADETPTEEATVAFAENTTAAVGEAAATEALQETNSALDCSPVKVPVAAPPGVPSPFKSTLFWPQPKEKKGKKRRSEKLPSVVTSSQMIAYYHKKETEKKEKEEAIKKRKIEREEKRKLAEDLKMKKIQAKNLLKKTVEDSSSSNSTPPLMESDDSPWHESFSSDEQTPQKISIDELATGDFVLVNFIGGNRNTTTYTYVCVIQNVTDEDVITVQGLLSEKTKHQFRIVENDISIVGLNQIVGKLPQANVEFQGRQMVYSFKKKIPVKEK